ncbi:MAG TPA: LPS export ABC transporter periplasmic protein LptC [Cytophagaceae bacterium]|jgi:LPS export ABC transporter protein LptC|nr:LPS export ABC transporter periplasmic protein LptC [Cytophagaceae bacterium]
MKARVFLGIACLCVLYSCKNNQVEELQPYKGALIEVDNVETLYTDSSRLKIRLTASKQLEFENGNREFPKGINIEFYDEKQVKTSTLTANYGKYNKEQNLYTVTGNVIIRNLAEGKSLKTEVLNWNPLTEKVYTEENVTIQTPEDILWGKGLDADQRFEHYKIRDPIGEMSVDETN